MQWKQINSSTIETYAKNPSALLDQITALFKDRLAGKVVGENQFVSAIPEYGFSRHFEVSGNRIWFSQDTDDECVHIVFINGVENQDFVKMIKKLLEELPD